MKPTSIAADPVRVGKWAQFFLYAIAVSQAIAMAFRLLGRMFAPGVAPQSRGTHLLMFKGFIPCAVPLFLFLLMSTD